MDKKRKLKPTSKRRMPKSAKYRYRHPQLMQDISDELGYNRSDVKKVFDCMIKHLIKNVFNKKAFQMPGFGTIYPFIVPERKGTALNGGIRGKGSGERIIIPTRWELKFRPSTLLRPQLNEMSITKEDLKLIYED